jgi:murein DD-endopeptidase MepM/ murein hydrolase activator NlpD
MKLKSIFAYLLILALLLPSSSAFATSHYDHTWSNTYYNNAEVQLGSPAWDGSWREVRSKNHQPRDCGTCSNPHRGTDIDLLGGEKVVSVYDGTIKRIDDDGSSSASITVSIAGTTKYVTYVHLNPYNDLSVGQSIKKGQGLGTILSGPNHLHFGVATKLGASTHVNDDVWNTNASYYKNISTWRYGKHLDFLAHEYYNTSYNIFSTDGYVYDGDQSSGNEVQKLDKVKIYYKPANQSTWAADYMSNVSGSDLSWQYSLSGKFSAGTLVEIVVIGYRAGITGHNWGVWPGYYRAPSDNISDWPSGFSTYVVEVN